MKGILMAAAAAFVVASPAAAQVTSYVSSNQAPLKGDANKIVCEKEETIGTRLGGRKVCLTVQQWNDKHKEHREFTEEIQAGTYARDSAVQVQAPLLQGLGPQ